MQLKRIKVSVIVPVYNVEKYLKECLASVINQTLKEIEIICVNDGSTDSSLKILKEYEKKDSRIKIIDKANGGLSSARNEGMKIAKGEYIGFVDSDDFVDSNMFKVLYDKANKNNADIIFCGIEEFDDATNKILNKNLAWNNFLLTKLKNKYFNWKDIKNILFKISPTAWNKIYKTKFIRQINALFPEDLYFEDNTFYLKTFVNAYKIGYIENKFYKYRINRNGSITASNSRKFFDIVKICNIMQDILYKKKIFDELKNYFYDFKIRAYINKFYYIHKDYKKEFFNIIVKEFKNIGTSKLNILDKIIFFFGKNNIYTLFNLSIKVRMFIKKFIQKT